MSKKKKQKTKTEQTLEYRKAHGIENLFDIIQITRPSLIPSYREFLARWGVRCVAPNCEYGRVFGEVCRACKGTGLIHAPKGHE